MINNFTIKILDSVADIEKHRSDWIFLQKKYACIDPNADIDHFLTVIKFKYDVIKPYVLILFQNTTPISIIAGRIEHSYLPCTIGYKEIFSLKVTSLTIIYGGLMTHPSKKISDLFLNTIKSNLKNGLADLAEFHMVNEDSSFFKSYHKYSHFLLRDFFPKKELHWIINFNKTEKTINYVISKNEIKKNRKRYNKLIQAFPNIEIRHYYDKNSVNEMLQYIEKIACLTYQRSLDTGFQYDALTKERFFLAAEKKWLNSYLLFINGEAVAYQIGFIYNNCYYAMGRGFNPEFKQFALGTILFFHALENSILNNNISCWDYGCGDAVHKRIFGNCSFNEYTFKIFSPSLRGLTLNLRWTIVKFIEAIAKYIFKNADIVSFKTKWRNSIRKKYLINSKTQIYK